MKLNALLEEFNTSIAQLQQKENRTIPLSKKIITLSHEILWKMNTIMKKNDFNSVQSEINFFKQIKPVPLSSLIYRKELIGFESFFPKICPKQQDKYFNHHLTRLQRFFSSNIDFGQYIEMDCTHLDEHYFTRNSNEKFTDTGNIINLQNPEFSSPKGTLLAQFKAYCKLVLYIRKKKLSPYESANEQTETHRLKWVGSKVDLIELIYAVHSSGSLKKETGLKEVAGACEKLFEVDLGNYYRKFIELKNRKMVERTQYIDRLKSSLIDRMNQADD
ncbi:RteC domain-containing protein [Aquimarina sp. U1-2]|uniref:RteC domain-containing protein n=1 Tax=Aquimarina sp. U1-2 TaxID=2823141 RepID=UPI001AECE1C6|nr:RteC domain-containing protein [Aquimarina sp. U1-2]MBP2831830.1 RteC domain-containing protein [Aquimarina sp. U1-2]